MSSKPSLDADVETANLLVSRPGITATAAQFPGPKIVAEELRRRSEARQSVITETVFASEAIIPIMRQAAERGFNGVVCFLALPGIDVAIRRVARQLAKGGHDAPEADIRRRWPRAHENLARAVTVAAEGLVFANEGGRQPVRLAARAPCGSVVFLENDAPAPATAALARFLG